ncbi:MAG: glucosyl transferase [Ignavibacteriaceae bacterium]
MDTTSHNFSWQSWTFGEHSSSVLRDVAIIDENNIWVVGEIYQYDSLGQLDPTAYNVVHWDGIEWKFYRIMFYTICGQQSRTPYPASAIFAFNESEVWIGMDGRQIARINGIIQVETICPPFSMIINKIWGTSSNDLYIVGYNGNIAYYNGSSWQKVESGTDVDVQDIWGIANKPLEPLILCAASNVLEPGDHTILSININNKIDTIGWKSDRRINSTWFKGDSKLFACGAGVFIRNDGINWEEQTKLPLTYTRRIRGTDNNDVFVAGDFGFVAHYNGSSWKEYPGANVALFYSLDYKNEIMVAVGERNGKGVVLIMQRE